MPTLLEVLTEPNVAVDSSLVNSGPNTKTKQIIDVGNWRPWRDFTYQTITRIFQAELDRSYRGSEKPQPLPEDLRVFNEECFDDLLRRFEVPIVNYALNKQDVKSHYGRGTRCGVESEQLKPDWSLVSDQRLDDNGLFTNLVPGDTKLDKKWRPDMRGDEDDYHEWQKVMNQILLYMTHHRSRYGFVITDGNLVVFRITRRLIEPGIAASRPRRALVNTNFRNQPDISMASSGDLFQDNQPSQWPFHDPEYAVVSWNASGKGKLTIKLALWALAKMAVHGGNSIEYSYPGLDTWRHCMEGHYIHNTSGAKKDVLGRKDKHEELDSAGEASGSNATTVPESASQIDVESYTAAWARTVEDTSQFSHYSEGETVVDDYEKEEDDDEDYDDEDDNRTVVSGSRGKAPAQTEAIEVKMKRDRNRKQVRHVRYPSADSGDPITSTGPVVDVPAALTQQRTKHLRSHSQSSEDPLAAMTEPPQSDIADMLAGVNLGAGGDDDDPLGVEPIHRPPPSKGSGRKEGKNKSRSGKQRKEK